MDFSIIIPLYNERSNVEDLLESLLSLNYDRGLYEIIIVDNNSTDDTAAVVGGDERVVLLSEQKKGSYAARNKGIEAAAGDYFCFTDGDCLVDENWLLEMKRVIDDRAPALIAGKVVNTEPQKNLFSRYDDLCFLRQEHFVKDNAAATANLATKNEVFAAVGSFDEGMLTGGDVEFVQRAVRQGFELLYNDRAVVYHKSRTSFTQIRNKLLRFWQNERRYPGTWRKVLSLGVLPGGRTIVKAFWEKRIGLLEFVGLSFLSLRLGCSVMVNVCKGKAAV